MPTIEAATYKELSHESHVGNVNKIIMDYTLTGAEANGTVVKLRKRNEFHTYLSMRIIADAGCNAGTDIHVGYLDREEDGTDDTDFFVATADIVASQDIQAFVLPKELAKKHDIVLVINDNNALNAGKKIKIIAESIVTSG